VGRGRTERRPGILRGAAWAACLAAALGPAASTPAPAQSPPPAAPASSHDPAGLDALNFAFRFATAIATDARDRSRAQEAVVLDLAALGAIDQALERAEWIEDWRRGTALADLAVALVQEGKAEEARKVIARAEEFRKGVTDWKGLRIEAHISQALAALGEVAPSRKIASELAASDPRQYAGRAAATVASAHAVRGEFDEAMLALAGLGDETDLEIAWWRTAGYLGVARQAHLSRPERLKALDAARRSAETVAGWKRAETLESIAEEYRLLGQQNSAREALNAADRIVVPLAPTMPIKAPLLSNLARAWARLGEKPHARSLLRQALEELPQALLIDRPAILANIAGSYGEAGDEKEERRLYDRALESAEGLVNARPRALAAVEICRSLARRGQSLDDPTRQRLERLLGGLKAPW
jgi:tetratricopeptide (TPR) repeat protein